ncbi:bacterial transcriptional activator domain-containing protein, partial [Micromonospora sp. NPDC047793]|uniref:AfsR/SARP family transcriptional regulator n=1 Tax=Micromonospora sp. NPDC047793 TaxID=3154342 RepID=UPI0033F5615A
AVVLAWLLWAFVAYIITVRVAVRMWAGVRWLRRLPLPTPWQATATGIAGAAALTIPTPATPAVGVDAMPPTGNTGLPTPVEGERAGLDGGVAVAGGWLPREVADQVTVAVGLMWLRRRRDYRPTSSRPAGGGDALTPLPVNVAAITAATAGRPPPASAGAPPAGLPSAGVGLVGPGASHAVRGLLVSVLLTAMRQTDAQVVITRSAGRILLGPAAERLRPGAGLMIVDTITHAALAVTSPPAVSAKGTDGRRAPAVLILDAPPTDTVVTGAAVPVVLGPWPEAAVWHVDADGRTADDTAGHRMCVLDEVATADLLTVTGHLDPPAPDTSAAPAPTTRIPRQAGPRRGNSSDLRLRVLGEPDLLVEGSPVALRRSAAWQALVFLAVHADGADSHLMAEALWPGLPAHRLTGRLYTTLSELRTAARTTTGATIIDRSGDRYRLHPTNVDVDLWHLHTTADHAAATLTDTAAAWQAVITAYTGDLATGHTWPWLEPHRIAARRRALDAYAALADTAPDPHTALAHLQGGIRVDPYNADLHQQAARLLTDLGEQAAAVVLTDRYRRRLTAAGLSLDGPLVPDGT